MSLRNRLGNAKNVYQTPAKRVLTVCSAGILRSPTLANVLHNKFGFNTRACGVSKAFALVILDPVLICWADEIVFVEQDVLHEALSSPDLAQALKDHDPKVVVLDVPDCYNWNDPELKDECLAQYKEKTDNVLPH